MITADGWRVVKIVLDDGHGPVECFRVTFRGYAMGSANPKTAGTARDLAAVATIMGEAFAHLQEES